MSVRTRALLNNTEAGIFARILANSKGAMTRELSNHVLTLGFSDADQARMDDLATRNQGGELSAKEHQELMNYVRAGHLLALLHSKARKSLKKKIS